MPSESGDLGSIVLHDSGGSRGKLEVVCAVVTGGGLSWF
jgi:hypothetical protein